MTSDEQTVELAIGRLLRIMSRPFQPGDIAEYERCRAILFDLQPDTTPDLRPCWTRDRLKGAAGDA